METTTALTLVIPNHFHDEINEIRKLYDRAYPRWMPHINFFFPFIDESKFGDVVSRLEPKLKEFGSFELELNELGCFKQGKNVTAHLKPKDFTRLAKLFEVIRNTCPEIQLKHDQFAPHLTIAQFKNMEKDEKMGELSKWLIGKNFKFVVDDICILQRSKINNSVPFSVHTRLPLL